MKKPVDGYYLLISKESYFALTPDYTEVAGHEAFDRLKARVHSSNHTIQSIAVRPK